MRDDDGLHQVGDDEGGDKCWGSAYMLTVKPTRIADRLELRLKRSWIQGHCLRPFGLL